LKKKRWAEEKTGTREMVTHNRETLDKKKKSSAMIPVSKDGARAKNQSRKKATEEPRR